MILTIEPISLEFFPMIFFNFFHILIKKLKIIEEFFQILKLNNPEFLQREFLWAGLSNFAVDPVFQTEIRNHFSEIRNFLLSEENPRTIMHILTVLYYLNLEKQKEFLIELKELLGKFEEKQKEFLENKVIIKLLTKLISNKP